MSFSCSDRPFTSFLGNPFCFCLKSQVKKSEMTVGRILFNVQGDVVAKIFHLCRPTRDVKDQSFVSPCTDKYCDFSLEHILKKLNVQRGQHLGIPKPEKAAAHQFNNSLRT